MELPGVQGDLLGDQLQALAGGGADQGNILQYYYRVNMSYYGDWTMYKDLVKGSIELGMSKDWWKV